MAAKRKMFSSGVSIPVGIVIGAAVSVAVMLLGALLAACLVMSETLSMDGIGSAASGISAIAAALGCWIASAMTKKQKLLVCGLTAIAFFLVMLSTTAVFFNGVYNGIGLTALMILLGVGASLLPGLRKNSGKRKLKIPAYR